ncbi:pyridoxamine 5'-phosphate oxidase family protein [Lapidilactobacillus mulanensis]|uniref:Pyridoxamine 5'-phosphate oxidase family protein n=1 Tax=Lapidilactobacillus mulanensis TaxID=2485999 RepID=A0ABW4DRF1_9LACO|nr:pyridoxamine 5'-phosphate oxidase family protein [Lapidilactobacillus mulanensis]
MIQLTDEMKKMLSVQLAFIATVDEDGNPNVGPKGTLRVLDDSHLIYNEMTGRQARHNVLDNGRISVGVASHKSYKGFRFVGTAKYYDAGEYFDQAVAFAEKINLSKPYGAVVITIDKIQLLDATEHAGETIQE